MLCYLTQLNTPVSTTDLLVECYASSRDTYWQILLRVLTLMSIRQHSSDVTSEIEVKSQVCFFFSMGSRAIFSLCSFGTFGNKV